MARLGRGYARQATIVARPAVPGPALVGAAGLSGDGALSATGAPGAVVTQGLSGSGTLAATGMVIAAQGFFGTGALTTTGAPGVAASQGFSGDGALTIAGVPAVTVPQGLSGSGTLTTTGVPKVAISQDLSGSGALIATAAPKVAVAQGFSGAGALTMIGAPRFAASQGLSGSGTLTVSGVPGVAPSRSLSGSGTLTVIGKILGVDVSRGFSGAGVLTVVGALGADITQASYQFYGIGAGQATDPALAAQDTTGSADVSPGSFDLSLRIRLQSTNAANVLSTDDFQLQWEKNTSGTWTDVVTGGSTVSGFATASLNDNAATINRLGTGTGSFTAGKISTDGLVDNLGWPAGNYTEVLYPITLKAAGLAHADTVRFRVLKNASSSSLTYASTPTLTVVNIPVAPTARTLDVVLVTSSTTRLLWSTDSTAQPAPTYLVEQSTDGTNFTTATVANLLASSVTVTGLSPQPYWFRITGSNSAGSATSAVIGPITNAPLSFTNSMEGGTPGVLVATGAGGTGGNVFNYGGSPISLGVRYDNTRAHSGTLSVKMTLNPTQSAYLGWSSKSPQASPNPPLGYGLRAVNYWRGYLYLTQYPTEDLQITYNPNNNFGIILTSTGTVKVLAAGTPGTVSVALNQWVRLEGVLANSASVRIFNDPESTTPTEIVTAGTYASDIRFAFGGNAPAASTYTYWLDDIAISDVDWIGPRIAATQTVDLSGTGTLSAVGQPFQAVGLSGSGMLSTAGVGYGPMHSIWANSAPPGTAYARYNDGVPVRVGMTFYSPVGDTQFGTGSKIMGARLWCPPGLTMPATVQFSAYLGSWFIDFHTYYKVLTDPLLVSGEPAPDATVTVPITVSSVTGGWQEATFPTPLDMPGPGYPMLIACRFPDAPNDYLATTNARSVGTFGFPFIQASDGSDLFWSEDHSTGGPESFYSGYFRYGTNASDLTDGNIGYGIDLRVSEPAGSGASFSGTANLSGSGALSATVGPGFAGTVGLNGAGSLVGTGQPSVAVPVGLSGSGLLSPVAKPGLAAAPSLSGSGSLSVVGVPALSVPLGLSGSGSLSFVSVPALTRAVGLSGSGSLTGLQTLVRVSGTLALAGSGSLGLVLAPSFAASAGMSGSGSLAVQTLVGTSGTLALSGSGTLAVTGKPALAAQISLTGSGTLAGAGGPSFGASVDLAGSGSLSPTGSLAVARVLGFSGSGALTLTAAPAVPGSVSLSGSGSLTTVTVPALAVSTALSGSGVLSFVGGGSVLALSGTGSLSATGAPALARAQGLSGTGVLSFVVVAGATGSAVLSGSGSLTTQVIPALAVAAGLQGQGILSTSTTVTLAGQVGLAGNGTLLVQSALAGAALVFLTGSGSLSSSALVAVTGARGLSGDGLLTVAAAPRTSGTLALAGSGTLATSVVPALAVSLGLSGTGQLVAVGAPRVSGSVALAGTGSLNAVGASAGAGLTALSGSGTLSMTVVPGAVITQGLSGSGTLSATLVSVSASITQALSGSGLLSATTAPALAAQLQLSGTGALTLTGALRVTALVGLAGSGVLTAAGTGTEQAGSAVGLTGSGLLSTQVFVAVSRTGALTGLGTLSASVQIDIVVTVELSGTGTLNLVIAAAFSTAVFLSGDGELLGALGISDTVVVAGIHHLVMHRWVIIGGLKKPVVNTSVIVGEQKHPTVTLR